MNNQHLDAEFIPVSKSEIATLQLMLLERGFSFDPDFDEIDEIANDEIASTLSALIYRWYMRRASTRERL